MGPIVGSADSAGVAPSPYARVDVVVLPLVLAEPGTLRFSAAGLVACLPISMVGLGIVLLVSSATAPYGPRAPSPRRTW